MDPFLQILCLQTIWPADKSNRRRILQHKGSSFCPISSSLLLTLSESSSNGFVLLVCGSVGQCWATLQLPIELLPHRKMSEDATRMWTMDEQRCQPQSKQVDCLLICISSPLSPSHSLCGNPWSAIWYFRAGPSIHPSRSLFILGARNVNWCLSWLSWADWIVAYRDRSRLQDQVLHGSRWTGV